ncbi:AGE family epimerase/isomerase [Litorimonas sp. RW-G-Af-16]|uniref:AGE family epimerase/isomerase n=1 Tax=Litorimonas sp. RW-G-Af-16 TaxID=3241168 RepID=UPI00390CC742
MNTHQQPVFDDEDFLEGHIQSTLAFYEPRVFSDEGGFYGCFLNNGECYDPDSRQLVGSARYVVNYATAYRLYGKPQHLEWAQWGLDYLTNYHREPNGGYAWLLEKNQVTDSRVMAYGHAFVVLAAATCLRAGIVRAKSILYETYDFLDTYFWDEAASAYNDERDSTLKKLSNYRGQNANMHMCEALIAAWQATADPRFLDRAERLANRFAFDLAAQTDGQIWEHYTSNWQADMQFNIDKPNDRYKPWGFQPGHQTEWSKLLLMLDRERPNDKWLPRAKALYDHAIKTGWDAEFGGIFYGVDPCGKVCADEKHFWVHAETFATAWRLYHLTRDERYMKDYQRIWCWSWKHLIDHKNGAWFRVRKRDGSPITNKKSPLGKTDYHTLGACWDVLEVSRLQFTN